MALTAEVLRSLIKHHGLGQSIQRTAKAVGLSTSTVKRYFDRIAAANLTWQEAKSRTQEELMASLQPTRRTISNYCEPLWYMHALDSIGVQRSDTTSAPFKFVFQYKLTSDVSELISAGQDRSLIESQGLITVIRCVPHCKHFRLRLQRLAVGAAQKGRI